MKWIALYLAIGAIVSQVYAARFESACPHDRLPPDPGVVVFIAGAWPFLVGASLYIRAREGKWDQPSCALTAGDGTKP